MSKGKLPECTVCWDSPDGPILQCAEGHLICEACDKDLRRRKCPTCRMALGPITKPIRNRVAEQAIAESEATCKHCGEQMTRADLALHQCKVEHYTKLQGNEVLSHAEFYEAGKEVRTEFYEAGKHVRAEFPVGHKDHGKIWHFVDGKHVRTEFAPGHKCHGQIRHLVDGKHVRIEHAAGHARHGGIGHFVDGKHVRTEFGPGHARHGEIHHFVDGKHVRIEHAPGHADHGEIHHYVDDEHVRTEYAPGHARHGEICHCVDGEQCKRAPSKRLTTRRA